jgi:heme/copper-type cytochrome/quinol oxidase subunit 4
MCFSATASFVASGSLLLMAAATFAVARKKDKVLIAIPVLFAIQQVFEGVQWLYLGRGSTSTLAGYGFLIFAFLVWPVYVPACVLILDPIRKRMMRWFLTAGVLAASYFIIILATQPLRIRERTNCVNYTFDLPGQWFVAALYVLAILGPLLFSSRAVFRWFGLIITGLAVVAGTVYHHNFISVWCFFSAAVSGLFFLYVQRKRSRKARQ